MGRVMTRWRGLTCVLPCRRARIGESDDERARWADLEALGCVAQVNAPSTSESRDADVNHRARHSHGALCQWKVSEVVGRDGAIGKVVLALLGENARLFNDQYVVKPPARSDGALRASCFEWHHDSQWCDDDGKTVYAPYLSAWVALDDVNEENGTLRFLPYPTVAGEQSSASHRERAQHYPAHSTLPSPLSDDIDDIHSKLLTVRAGSVVFFSDAVLHCSGPNISETIRRAWMPQFSSGPIVREDGRAVGLTAKLV
jgi:ectoine hydroxylase-related dioxygenase (phytanoyl-CoA dioxygenase family)